MPAGSSPKRERQYEHIKAGLKKRGKSTDVAEEIAAVVGKPELLRPRMPVEADGVPYALRKNFGF